MSKINYIIESGILTPIQLELIKNLKNVSDKIDNTDWEDGIYENNLVDAVENFLSEVYTHVGREMMS